MLALLSSIFKGESYSLLKPKYRTSMTDSKTSLRYMHPADFLKLKIGDIVKLRNGTAEEIQDVYMETEYLDGMRHPLLLWVVRFRGTSHMYQVHGSHESDAMMDIVEIQPS